MADWQRRLDLQPEWQQAKSDEISIRALANTVANRLVALPAFGDDDIDDERDDLAYEFANLANDQDATTEKFDVLMEGLWNWGDRWLDGKWNGKKVCWIKTF